MRRRWDLIQLPTQGFNESGAPDETNIDSIEIRTDLSSAVGGQTVRFDSLKLWDANETGTVTIRFDDGATETYTEAKAYMDQ